MILPRPTPTYDQRQEVERNRILEAEDTANLKRGRNLDLGLDQLILTNALGVRYRVVIDNEGDLGVEEIA